MNFYYILNLIKKRLWLLIIVPIVGAASAFFVLSTLPDKYQSTAQIATGFTTDESVKLTDERFNIGKMNQEFNNLIEKLGSEQVVSLVGYNLILHDLKSERPYRNIDYKRSEKFSEPTETEKKELIKQFEQKLKDMELLSSFDPEEKRLIEFLKLHKYNSFSLKESGLNIHRVKNTDYIAIDFESENPVLAAFVVNNLCEEFIRYNKQVTSSLSDESVSLLSKLVNEKKDVLDEKNKALSDFKSNNQVLNQKLESDLKLSQISDLEIKRQDEESNIRALRLSIAKGKAKLANQTTSTNNNSKVLQLRSRINKLNQLYIEGGSSDEPLKKTIDGLREELQIEMAKLDSDDENVQDKSILEDQVESYELELDIAESNLNRINNTLNSLKSQISNLNTKESALDVLTGEVEMASKEYNSALDKYNEYQNKSLVLGNSIRVVKQGQPALEPESSHTLVLTGLAGAASFFICVVFLVLLEFVDLRIKTADTFRKMTKLRLAGSINEITNKKLQLNDIFSDSMASQELVMFKQLLRKIRFELESMKTKAVLVTSTKQGEGKTFFIISLAYSLSLIKKRILIIDTNFKNNGLTKLLIVNSDGKKRLRQGNKIKGYLINDIGKKENRGEGEPTMMPNNPNDQSQDFDDNIIFRTAHENIDIIGSHTSANSPMEILAGKDFKTMLEAFKVSYDYILMEGASLNDFPDAKELVEYADVVLPIFSAESVIKQEDKESINYLKNLNGKLMGAVLNKVDNENLKI
ncbi:Wzz/FepE/Etk N-terminal domain-containing protein [Fulvivirga sp.]|uniref:exopolysaccharide transport family protein n=1 Tax=Fulvivirga sp. TaxID=1931237 RepID=UPI0032EEC15F